MGVKASAKLAVDMAMTILLMLLMAFELVGRSAHEWLGMGMFVLFVLHHAELATPPFSGGRYTSYRILQTAVAGLVFLGHAGILRQRGADLPGGVRLPVHPPGNGPGAGGAAPRRCHGALCRSPCIWGCTGAISQPWRANAGGALPGRAESPCGAGAGGRHRRGRGIRARPPGYPGLSVPAHPICLFLTTMSPGFCFSLD